MLKTKRIESKLTQKDLAEILGVHQSYISDLELNKRIPSLIILRKLCQELKICPIHLIDFFLKENDIT